jgi:hypothetical protein
MSHFHAEFSRQYNSLLPVCLRPGRQHIAFWLDKIPVSGSVDVTINVPVLIRILLCLVRHVVNKYNYCATHPVTFHSSKHSYLLVPNIDIPLLDEFFITV